MLHCCSVRNCNINYRNLTKAVVFGFPKQPESLTKWTRAIKEDFEPTVHSYLLITVFVLLITCFRSRQIHSYLRV